MKRQSAITGWRVPVLVVGIIGAGALLYWISGGFPPMTWRTLLRTIPQVHDLWGHRGAALLFPFGLLALQSVALLVAWVLLAREAVLAVRLVFFSAPRSAPQAPEIWSPMMALPSSGDQLQDGTRALPAPEEDELSPLLASASTRSPHEFAPLRTTDALSSREVQGPVETDKRKAGLPLPEVLWEERSGTGLQTSTPERVSASLSAPADSLSSQQEGRAVVQPELVLLAAFASHTGSGAPQGGAPQQGYPVLVRGIRRSAPPQSYGVFLLGDESGGHATGQLAGVLAAKAVTGALAPLLEEDRSGPEQLGQRLIQGVHDANEALYRYNQDEGAFLETTVTGGVILGNRGFIVNVGDCRTYLYRPSDGLSALTSDHTEVAQKVEQGELLPEALYTHPRRGVLLRSLGEKPQVEVDACEIRLQEHDRLLFCSRGFWEALRDSEIQALLSHAEANDTSLGMTAKACTQAAVAGGGASLSVLIVYVVASSVHAHERMKDACNE